MRLVATTRRFAQRPKVSALHRHPKAWPYRYQDQVPVNAFAVLRDQMLYLF